MVRATKKVSHDKTVSCKIAKQTVLSTTKMLNIDSFQTTTFQNRFVELTLAVW